MKQLLLILICLVFTNEVSSQAINKYGQGTSTVSNFINKNGRTGSIPSLGKNGQIIILVTLTTTAASNVSTSSAISGGNITSDGGATVTARGVCWSTSPNPTTANRKTIDGGGSGVFSSSITGLTIGTIYYVRAYATSSGGTSYGDQVSFTTTMLSVGAMYQGGKIAYILQSGDPGYTVGQTKGFISAPDDQSNGIRWYNGTYLITGATGTALGTGMTNTNMIVASQGSGSYSAKLCYDYTNPDNGTGVYSDWYLPSKDELYKVNLKKSVLGTTGGATYESSSEFDINGMWLNNFYDYSQYVYTKSITYYVRAVRSFPAVLSATTTTVKSITATSSSVSGDITSDGGLAVTARGICWSTSTTPTTANSKTTNGTGIGAFTGSLTGLAPGTTYYARAYATNSEGTSYGSEISFTTLATFATLTTTAASSVNSTTAGCGGNISSDGTSPITVRGVCWNTSPNPTTSNSVTTDGTGTGAFTSSLSALAPGTTYYVRAYATNGIGTAYGNEIIFSTPATLATLTTTTASAITSISATSGGNISSNGGAAITARGVCWSTSTSPTIDNNITTNGTGSGTFASPITGLTLGTTYYVRAYATNSVGTAYGNEVSFTASLAIGDTYQGGKIAYILQVGDPGYVDGQKHGIIAATTDQSTSIQWGSNADFANYALETALGTGNANTNAIVSHYGEGNYAAKLCYDLEMGGYSDWYLPSINELNLVYLNKASIGVFANAFYWSSTQITAGWGKVQHMGNGVQSLGDKENSKLYVRAIRSF